jgi:uncharacterized membrane protein YdbT with pleckstrin-like domain
MASYIEQVLIQGEHLVYRARISVITLMPLILLGVATVWIFGLGLVFWIMAWIKYATTELAITNKRVIAKSGLIQRKTMEMFLNKIESVQVEQGVLARMFDYGTVTIAGTGVHTAAFADIAKPLEFRKHFMSAADTPNQDNETRA